MLFPGKARLREENTMDGIKNKREDANTGRKASGKRNFLGGGVAFLAAVCLLIPAMPADVFRAAGGESDWGTHYTAEPVWFEVDLPSDALTYTDLQKVIDDSVKGENPTPIAIRLAGDIALEGSAIQIPEKAQIKLTSAEGGPYTISASQDNGKRGRVIEMRDTNALLALENITITDGYASDVGGGVYVNASGCELVLEDDGSIADNEVNCSIYDSNNSANNMTIGGGGVYVGGGAFFTMRGGTVSGNKAINTPSGDGTNHDPYYAAYGGGVYADGAGGASFEMRDGTISGNEAKGGNGMNYNGGGGVFVGRYATVGKATGNGIGASFDMSGGTISDNEVRGTGGATGGGVFVFYGGAFSMSGNAAIRKNTSWDMCGAIDVTYGGFTMTGGNISDNTAANSTGGAGIFSRSAVTMSGGTISGNTAGTYAGGVSVNATGTLNMTGVTISGNTAGTYAGGVRVISDTINMTDVTVSGNTAGTHGGGVYVRNNVSLTLNGSCEITGNTATAGDGGGIYAYVKNNVYANLTVSPDASVIFSGNKAGALYKLSEEHKSNPPRDFEGSITGLSVPNINEINDFENKEILSANKKSVFNNYDINYTDGDELNVCAVKYLDEDGQPIAGYGTFAGIDGEKGSKYTLGSLAGPGYNDGSDWTLKEKEPGLSVVQNDKKIEENDLLRPDAGVTLGSSVKTSYLTLLAPLREYEIAYDAESLEGVTRAPDPKPASYTKNALPLLIGVPEKTGYDFGGWTADCANGASTDIKGPDCRIPTGTTGDIKLTANWTENAKNSVADDGNESTGDNSGDGDSGGDSGSGGSNSGGGSGSGGGSPARPAVPGTGGAEGNTDTGGNTDLGGNTDTGDGGDSGYSDDSYGDVNSGDGNGPSGGRNPYIPPVPRTPGGSVISSPDADNVFIEVGEDGVPLGEWRWNDAEGQWVYEQYVLSNLGDLPQTGRLWERNGALTLLMFLGWLLVVAGLTHFAVPLRKRVH
jgi:uncharacterized repeat protein (TIGR02543 family)